jgi:hypothetical protein
VKRLAPMLERAVSQGLISRELAEARDAWAGELAARVMVGDLSEEECARLVTERAQEDAREVVRRRRS